MEEMHDANFFGPFHDSKYDNVVIYWISAISKSPKHRVTAEFMRGGHFFKVYPDSVLCSVQSLIFNVLTRFVIHNVNGGGKLKIVQILVNGIVNKIKNINCFNGKKFC
jgi:hypothetical protein